MSWKFSLEYINCALIESWIGENGEKRHSWTAAGKLTGEILHSSFILVFHLPDGSFDVLVYGDGFIYNLGILL